MTRTVCQTEDESALLRAILEAPDDDAPRLVYADWLDERAGPGDPDQAEFIRLQVELPRWPDPLDPRVGRARALLRANYEQWVAARPAAHLVRWGFARGFPNAVAGSAGNVADLFRKHGRPAGLTAVHLRNLRGISGLCRRPEMAGVTSLDLGPGRIEAGNAPAAFRESAHLTNLTRLAARAGRAQADALAGLACSPRLTGLRDLDLSGSSAAVLATVTGRLLPARPDLRELGLDGLRAGRLNVTVLTSCPARQPVDGPSAQRQQVRRRRGHGPGRLAGAGRADPAGTAGQ